MADPPEILVLETQAPRLGRRFLRARFLVPVLLFVLAMVPTGLQIGRETRAALDMPRGGMKYNDMLIFLGRVRAWKTTGQLYALDQPDFADPGSAVYKYPPTLAAMLLPLNNSRPGQWRKSIRVILAIEAAVLLAALAAIVAVFRPGAERFFLITAVFLNWQPFRESLAGPQIEPLMLLLLALGLLGLRSGRSFLAGAAAGAAGALKVYPWGLAAWFGARRDWKALAGLAAGTLITLAAASAALTPGLTVAYFTRILPRLGGTSLSYENVGAPALLGRAIVRLGSGREALVKLTTAPVGTLEASGAPAARPLLLGSLALIAAVLVFATARALRGRRGWKSGALGLGASLCLLLFLMPTSWPDYQTLLVLPLAAGLAFAPPPRKDPLTWALLAAAGVSGIISVNNAPFSEHISWIPLARAWMPLAIWGSLLRILRGNFELDLPRSCPTL